MAQTLLALLETAVVLGLLGAIRIAEGQNSTLILMETDGETPYKKVTPPDSVSVFNLSRLCFSVKSCHEARLMISRYSPPWPEDNFDIQIRSDNNITNIRIDSPGNPKTNTINQSLLSCEEFRSFYVEWTPVNVTVGAVKKTASGDAEEEVLIITRRSEFATNVVSVATSGKTGSWTIDFDCEMLLNAPPTKTATTPTASGEPPAATGATTTTPTAKTEAATSPLRTTTTGPVTTKTASETSPATTSTPTATTEAAKSPSSSTTTTTKTTATTTANATRRCAVCTCTVYKPTAQNRTVPTTENAFKELLIPASATSAYRRKRTSAEDKRLSSAAIGAFGIACIAIPIGLILLSDVTTLIRQIERRRKRSKVEEAQSEPKSVTEAETKAETPAGKTLSP